MDFNFVDDETPEEDDEEFLDLSDLYDEEEVEEEPEVVEVAGMDFAFQEEVPEAKSITDIEVRKKALKKRRKGASKKSDNRIGSNTPYVHGLCKEGVGQGGRSKLPANHSVCQNFEEWNVRAGIPCACTECNHPQTLEELTYGKGTRKSTKRQKRQRLRQEPESLSGSSDEEFVLVLD